MAQKIDLGNLGRIATRVQQLRYFLRYLKNKAAGRSLLVWSEIDARADSACFEIVDPVAVLPHPQLSCSIRLIFCLLDSSCKILATNSYICKAIFS